MPPSSSSAYDITQHTLTDHDSIGSPSSHIGSLTLFRDSVVRPSLKKLDDEIDRLRDSKEPAADFFADDYAELFQTTLEGYLIAVQSMWERGLRSMLIRRAKKLTPDADMQVIAHAKLEGLKSHFLALIGLPLDAFSSYSDLYLLQNLGNAIRHGDGHAAQRVHALCPRLWFNWLSPGEEIVAGPFRIVAPNDGPKHPSFNEITLPEALLDQMIQSVLWFWEDIENLRCNSFTRKHPSTVVKLSRWKDEIQSRSASRVWRPADGAFPPNVEPAYPTVAQS